MIMIIGGAYQGKLAFAKKIYPDVTWADGAVCTEEELYSCEGIYHFHQYIERKIKEGEPIDDLAEELIRKNPELILITDEIGYGIVPVLSENPYLPPRAKAYHHFSLFLLRNHISGILFHVCPLLYQNPTSSVHPPTQVPAQDLRLDHLHFQFQLTILRNLL